MSLKFIGALVMFACISVFIIVMYSIYNDDDTDQPEPTDKP